MKRHDMKTKEDIAQDVCMRRRRDLKKSQEVILEYMDYVHLSHPTILLLQQDLQSFWNYIQGQYSKVAPDEERSKQYVDEIDEDGDFILPS